MGKSVDRSRRPLDTVRDNHDPSRRRAVSQVYTNACLSDRSRVRTAAHLLGKYALRITGKKGKALLDAHQVGGQPEASTKTAPAGIKPDGTSNFTVGQLRQKHRVLKKAGYTSSEIRKLFEAGLAGKPLTYLTELSGGNPGALSVISRLAAHPLGLSALEQLNLNGIRGAEIWLLFKDEHGENLDRMIGSLSDGSWRSRLEANRYSVFSADAKSKAVDPGKQSKQPLSGADSNRADKAIKLRTGVTESQGVVLGTMIALKSLMKTNPIALYELTELARNPDHTPFGNAGEVLQSRNLLQTDGRLNQSVKNVVLAATTGDGLELALTSPLPPSSAAGRESEE